MEKLYYTPSYVEPINAIILKVNEIVCALNAIEATSTSTNSGYATALGKCLNEWGYDHGISLPCHRWEDLYQRLNALKAEHFA